MKKVYAKLTSDILLFSEEFFAKKGFIQLLPIMLSPTTDPLGPDPGSSVIKTPEVEYYGQRLVTTQSMILHKQIAIKMGLKKIFILSPNIRLEKKERSKTGKHLFEFTQLDFEIAYGKMDDVFSLMEEYFVSLFDFLRKERMELLEKLERDLPKLKTPFPRYTTHELEEKYGKDWEIPASLEEKTPFWVICHKREFYDKEDLSKPGHYLNYDLIYPKGFGEALSGGEREYKYERILERMKRDRLPLEKYKPYLDIAKDGLIPSTGAGFGIERLVRFISGAKHVGDVQLFPRVPGEKVVF